MTSKVISNENEERDPSILPSWSTLDVANWPRLFIIIIQNYEENVEKADMKGKWKLIDLIKRPSTSKMQFNGLKGG